MKVNFKKIEKKVNEEYIKISFWKKILPVFIDPKRLFELTKKEKTFFPALWFITPFILFFSFASITTKIIFSNHGIEDIISIPFVSLFLFAIITIVIFVFFSFLPDSVNLPQTNYGIIPTIIYKFFRPKTKQERYKIFKAFLYGLPPSIMIYWIPFVPISYKLSLPLAQLIGFLWTLSIQIKGIYIYNNKTLKESFLTISSLIILNIIFLGILYLSTS